jgi:hypothetical protein
VQLWAALFTAALVAWGRVAFAKEPVPETPAVVPAHTQSRPEAGGTHIRVATERGPVHIFVPAGFRVATAGIVVYVHGLYVGVDGAWKHHHLARQFAASGRNALFIAPEAPAAANEEPSWLDLDALIAAALGGARLPRPGGPLIVAGHSAAYRTIVPWLGEPSLQHVILIDALYGNEDDFHHWLEGGADRKLTLVVKGTARWADPFAARLPAPWVVTEPRIPQRFSQLSRAARDARLLYLRSQYGHMELASEGRVLPVLLRRTGLDLAQGGARAEGRR